ncbi:hypothetical protein BH10CYA1_BH10CYA1_38930 [soil metagenome]
MSDRLKKLIQPETLLPCLILLVLLNVIFFPVIWGSKTLIHSAGDASSIMPYGAYEQNKEYRQNRRSNDDGAPAWFSEPSYALLHNDYFKLAVPPLWNPYNGFGAPLLANMQSQPFNPLVLIACLNPSPRTDDLFVLARLLVAGVLTNLYLRRFIGAYGSIFGAIAFMLTGYMVMFINMPEISVSMWMPGLFLALELLSESISFNRIVLGGFFSAMILLGGMPEVAFLELFVCGIYFLVRVLVRQIDWKTRSRFFMSYALSCVIGLGLSAPQILPFLEYIRESSNSHAGTIGAGKEFGPGSVYHENFPVHFLNYLTPLIYGPLGDAKIKAGFGYVGFNGYWGVLVFAFALVASMSALARSHANDDNQTVSKVKPILFFFIGTVVVLVGKKFGAPLVSLISALPLFKLVVFWKYSEPIIGFAMAALAGIGFDLLATGKLKTRSLLVGFGIAIVMLTTIALYDKRFLWGDHVVHMVFNKILTISIVLICVAMLISAFALSKPTLRLKSCRLLLLLLCADLSISFLLPMFYWFHQLAERQANPYKGAPYIQYLQANSTSADRVFGFDRVLFPNWSSAFQIRDIRNLDAMYPARYLTFIRNFLTDKDPTELADSNLTTRFTGTEPIADPLFAEAEQSSLDRLWYLSSVQYLLGTRDHFLGKPSQIIQEVLNQTPANERQFLRLDAFTIDKQTKHVLFQHPIGAPSADSAYYACTINKDSPYLNFSIAIDPQVRDIADGDGMTFAIHVLSGEKETEVFTRKIEPKRNDADRHWISESIDLSKFAGSPIKLRFQVAPGANNNTAGDWGGWADLQLSATRQTTVQKSETPPPELVYDKEIRIYKTHNSLPKASMFYNFVLAKDDKDALEQIKSQKFDVRSSLILSANELEPAALPTAVPGEELMKQTISNDSPLAVEISVNAKHDGILMLNDQYYPGWNVYVDGKQNEVLRADYIFRAVLVKEGSHKVIFRYEPLSFYIGVCTFTLTLFGISAYAFFIGRRSP